MIVLGRYDVAFRPEELTCVDSEVLTMIKYGAAEETQTTHHLASTALTFFRSPHNAEQVRSGLLVSHSCCLLAREAR